MHQRAGRQSPAGGHQHRHKLKRELGQDVPILLGNESFKPEDFYKELFLHMTDCVKKVSSEPIENVYLTCPASFGRKKRDKIISAAEDAGLFGVQLVDEPTAAAMDYCAQGFVKDGQKLLVYDLGGGTFDVSLIGYEKGNYALLTEPRGLERCGGIDMDRLIYQDMLSVIGAEFLEQTKPASASRMRLESQLAELAVKAKHHLTTSEKFEDEIPYELTVEKFQGMIAGLVGQTITVCREILAAAGLEVSDLSSVLMVGGTSRVPLVQEMVKQFAGKVPVLYADDLELAVARGALEKIESQAEYERKVEDERKRTPNSGGKKGGLHSNKLNSERRTEELYNIGRYYLKGDKGYKAIEYFQKAAELGNADAQYELGKFYGIEDSEGRKFDQQAAAQGYVHAQIVLGRFYKGKNEKEGIIYYQQAAAQGNGFAQFELGECYNFGFCGVKRTLEGPPSLS